MIFFHKENTFSPIGHPFSPFIEPIPANPEPSAQGGPSQAGTQLPLPLSTLGYMKSSTLHWGNF